jgi:hypothetical protein
MDFGVDLAGELLQFTLQTAAEVAVPVSDIIALTRIQVKVIELRPVPLLI